MRGLGGVRKSEHQSWLAKRLGLRLLCWGFKGVRQEIPSEEASILQIGSVAFPAGQCTSSQLHPCHRLFHQDGHQDTSSVSLWSRRWSLWLLVIPYAQRPSLWDNLGDERGCDEGHWSYLPNPSARVGYDTRSLFKRSLTGLNSEFSFS